MSEKAKRLTVWTGYFDARLSRSKGRRVSREAAIPKPTLEAIAFAARGCGISKMRRESGASHPSRPNANEGRLVLSTADAMRACNASSKEGVMRIIGEQLAKAHAEQRAADEEERRRGPRKGDRRGRAQRGGRPAGRGGKGKRGSKHQRGRGGQRR